MSDDQVPGLIYGNQGGDTLTVQSGGAITIESGGSADFESGSSFKLAGTAVTSTAAELNILDGVTSTAAELNILDGVTSTAAELNILDGATTTVAELNTLAGALAGASIVVANANPSTATIQLQDADGADIAARAAVPWYLSDDAAGDSVTASAPAGGVAVGTDGVLIEWTADTSGMVVSEVDGDIDLTFTHVAGGVTWYLILVMPNGSLVASGAITPTA